LSDNKKTKPDILSQSIDVGKSNNALFLANNLKHIKTPSFTTSEEEKKRRGSDLLLRNREPSLIGPVMSLNNEEILRPYEIEYFSNNDGSPGSSPHVRGRSKANLNHSN
jgi:hypothetical protein